MKTSMIKILLTTALLTSTVIWLKLTHRLDKEKKSDGNLILKESEIIKQEQRRRLELTRAEYIDLCVTADNVTLGYAENFVGVADKLETYIDSLTYYDDSYNDELRTIIIDKDNNEIATVLVKIMAPYIIFGVFAIITVISWFVYCGCCWRPCCCCKATAKDESFCGWKGISCIVMLVSLCGIVAMSILGWIFAGKLPNHVEEIECSLIRFYTDVKLGEDTTNVPRWLGISPIVNKLDGISNALTEVYQNSQTGSGDTSDVSNTRDGYYRLLDEKSTKNSGTTTRNPNPSTSSSTPNVSPSFIQKFGPKEESDTTMGALKVEYDVTIYGAVGLLRELDTYTQQLNQNIDTGRKVFQNAADTVRPLETEIVVFETDYIDKYRDYKEKGMEKSNLAFAILYGIVCLFAIIFFLFSWCLVSFNKMGVRYISHIAWHLITLITIPLFLFACAFGFLGTAFVYMPSVMEILLSKEGLEVLFGTGSEPAKLLNVCFNGDGNMKTVIIPSEDSYTQIFDSFYNVSYTLDTITTTFSSTTSSQGISKAKELYTKMDSNIVLAPVVDQNSPATVLLALSRNTQKSANNTAIDSCSSQTDDMWVSDNNFCASGYLYISPSTPTENLGKKSCLNVREWTGSSAVTRYTDRNKCSGSDNSQTVSGYVTNINNYASDASPILTTLKLELDDIDRSYSSIALSLKDNLDKASNTYKPITNLLGSVAGEGGLWSLVNCNFMKDNIGQILNVLEDSGHAALVIGASLGALSLLNSLLLFFGLIYIFRFISSSQSGNLASEAENKTDQKPQ